MTNKNSETRLEFIAYHEAGHAIAAFKTHVLLGERVRVTIEPTSAFHGQTIISTPRNLAERELSPRAQRRAEDFMLTCLAGPAAQRRYNPRSFRGWHEVSDRREVARVLDDICGPNMDELSAYFRLMEIRARQFVEFRRNWRAIERLAAELLIRRTMSGSQLREFIAHECFGLPRLDTLVIGDSTAQTTQENTDARIYTTTAN